MNRRNFLKWMGVGQHNVGATSHWIAEDAGADGAEGNAG